MESAIIISLIVVVLIIVSGALIVNQDSQIGGEYESYIYMPANNSQRLMPLGYLSDQGYTGPATISPQRHASSSRIHPHHAVNTNGCDIRKPDCLNYIYKDEVGYYPYDWRPFEWKPFRLNKPSNCRQYSTNQCLGIGSSDYQSCLDKGSSKCH